MKCYCNVDTFTYETLEKDKDENNTYNRVLICKCGTFIIDGKKKTKCEFYNKKVLKTEIIIPDKKPVKINCDKYYINNSDVDEKCRKDINWNIHLIRIASSYPTINISNYIALINYNLRKLQYKPFFPNKESIENLTNRLKCKADDIRLSKTNTIYKANSKSKENKKQSYPHINQKYHYIIKDDEDEEDEYSDNSDEDGETFDVECYDSMDEIDNELEEAFSD